MTTIPIHINGELVNFPYEKKEGGLYFITGMDKIMRTDVNRYFNFYKQRPTRYIIECDEGLMILTYFYQKIKEKKYEKVITNCGAVYITQDANLDVIKKTYDVIDRNIMREIIKYFNLDYGY